MIQIASAVERGRSALGDHADLSAGGTAVLGLIAAGQDFEFLHSFEADGGHLVAIVAGVHVSDAVQSELIGIKALAVGGDIGQSAVPARREVSGADNSGG